MRNPYNNTISTKKPGVLIHIIKKNAEIFGLDTNTKKVYNKNKILKEQIENLSLDEIVDSILSLVEDEDEDILDTVQEAKKYVNYSLEEIKKAILEKKTSQIDAQSKELKTWQDKLK